MATRLHIVEEKFLKTIKENNLINKNDVIVIGVSGGPDSITLLTCLNKYKEKLNCKLIVAHINHLIRKDSTDDEKYVETICKNLKIKCYIKRIDITEIAKKEKLGTEEAGRKIRYEYFDEIAKKENANKIAIAHNMNDNAETMILNLIRGTGLTGLEGIQPIEYEKYIRPLINCTRKEIEDYCKKYKLKPRIDSTNKENIYRRNIIRNKILPQIEELNPNVIEALSRTSKIVKENNMFIKNEAELKYEKLKKYKNEKDKTKEAVIFNLKEFNVLNNTIKQNLILLAIEELFNSTRGIEKINIDDIIKLALNNIGEKYLLINKKFKILVKDKKLWLIKL